MIKLKMSLFIDVSNCSKSYFHNSNMKFAQTYSWNYWSMSNLSASIKIRISTGTKWKRFCTRYVSVTSTFSWWHQRFLDDINKYLANHFIRKSICSPEWFRIGRTHFIFNIYRSRSIAIKHYCSALLSWWTESDTSTSQNAKILYFFCKVCYSFQWPMLNRLAVGPLPFGHDLQVLNFWVTEQGSSTTIKPL